MGDYTIPDPSIVLSWRASSKLLQCPARCYSNDDADAHFPPQFLLLRDPAPQNSSWLRRLKCPRCSCHWAICIECMSLRTALSSQKQIRRHWTRNHASLSNQDYDQQERKRLRMMAAAAVAYDNCENHAAGDGGEEILKASALITFPFSGNHNVQYFQQDHAGLGVAYLVAKSQFGSSETTVAKDLLKEDVAFQLNLAGFLGSITRGQQHQFAKIMHQYNDLQQLKAIIEQADHSTGHNTSINTTDDYNGSESAAQPPMTPQWFSRMPMSFYDLRKIYIEGKHSFLPNLPRPPVQSLDRHDYVSLNDCIADIIAHGLKMDDIRQGVALRSVDLSFNAHNEHPAVTRTSHTMRAREIYDNGQRILHDHQEHNEGNTLRADPPPCLYLCITEWSDAFQPSSSIKARNSVWVKTVTISATSVHSLLFTYPIAVGEDGACHDEVEARFADELKLLASDNGRLFYHGGLKRNVKVYAEIFASLMDQPERRKSNAVLLGGSSFTARWGTCANFSLIASKVKACERCFDMLLKNAMTDDHGRGEPCTQCTCWTTENRDDLLHSDPPAGYPTDVIPASGKLFPFVMSHKTLRAAVETTHTKVLQGTWTKDKAHTYLRVQGVNKKSASEVIDKASNCRKLAGAAEGTMAHMVLALDAQRHPSMYQEWKQPAFWNRNVPMKRFVDAPMHLLFLGITKTIVTMMHEWLKQRDRNAIFLRYAKKAMLLPYKLALDWCKALPYSGGRLGGYIAENFLAIARLSGWFYSVLPAIATPRIRLSNPTEDVDKATWTMPQLRKWLMQRGMTTDGNRQLLMQRITASYDDQGVPPPIDTPTERPRQQEQIAGPVRNTQLCVSALQCMLCRLMKKSVTEQHALDCERHIFIFLSYFDEFDKKVRDRSKPPTWISSYNFLSLLNLPDVMRTYGPLRNLWEGGGQGEKVLTVVKPTWCGFRKNWRENMLDRMLRRMAIDRIQSKTRDSHEVMDKVGDGNAQTVENTEENVGEDETNALIPSAGKNYIMYKNDTRVREDIQNGAALSIVQIASGEYGCILAATRWLRLIPSICREGVRILREDDENNDDHDTSCTFFQWTVSNEGVRQIPSSENGIQQPIISYGMLLPKLNEEGEPIHRLGLDQGDAGPTVDAINEEHGGIYTLIDSNWDVLHHIDHISHQHDPVPEIERQTTAWIMASPKLSRARYTE